MNKNKKKGIFMIVSSIVILMVLGLACATTTNHINLELQSPEGIQVKIKKTDPQSNRTTYQVESLPYHGFSLSDKGLNFTILIPYEVYSADGFFTPEELKEIEEKYNKSTVSIDCSVYSSESQLLAYDSQTVPVRFLLRDQGEFDPDGIDEGTIQYTMLTGEKSYNYTKKDKYTIVTSILQNPMVSD